MVKGPRTRVVVVLALLALLGAGSPAASADRSPWEAGLRKRLPDSPALRGVGERVYERSCLVCHGPTGGGDGNAAALMELKPRNYRSGNFKLKTTPWGALPTPEDLFRTVTSGFPQYGMPAFDYLSEEDRWGVVYYLQRMLAASGRKAGTPLRVGEPPQSTPESVERGRALYARFGCVACHGPAGKGDGPLPRHFPEDFDMPDGSRVLPRDLTLARPFFKSGGTPKDIARTLMTGFEGTKMVSYLPALDDPKDAGPLWDLAHYVRQLSATGDGEAR